MGCRGQVKIGNVYLYTHWGADELPQTVQKALAKEWRWTDPEYLARIIFEEMIGDQKGKEGGFGIGNEQHGDIECLVEIDCENQRIRITRSFQLDAVPIWKDDAWTPFEAFIQWEILRT